MFLSKRVHTNQAFRPKNIEKKSVQNVREFALKSPHPLFKVPPTPLGLGWTAISLTGWSALRGALSLTTTRHLFGFKNEIYDLFLKKMEFRAGTAEDMVSKIADYEPRDETKMDTLMGFIHQIMPMPDERDFSLGLSSGFYGQALQTLFISKDRPHFYLKAKGTC